MRRRAPYHDPLLSLSIALFNFSSGWDRPLQKRQVEELSQTVEQNPFR
jgi:hypothetical protein